MKFKPAVAFAVFLIPGIMVFFGRLMGDHPPKTINGAYGYRTSMSMKNQDTWDYAQAAFAERWRRWGRGSGPDHPDCFHRRPSPAGPCGGDMLLHRF
ncbi:SdpI family protein [Aedoeadaptatus urinae]|uniref:SdpI family protein n=1 Tax=Aedoeadaptatus urinae TaxID=1871017 RepID=UPI00097D8F8C|nr:SdpI family protein [Peptoniphilus urinae]